MTEEMRQNAIQIAHFAFHAPVNRGKVYETIADLVRTEFGKVYGDGASRSGSGSVVKSNNNNNNGGGGGTNGSNHGNDDGDGGNNTNGGGGGTTTMNASLTSGGALTMGSGWSCVVGDAFGSCVTHRMKTYM